VTDKTRLELRWIGKDEVPRLEPRILLEDENRSFHARRRVTDKDVFDNRLIRGDNLLALKALEQEFLGKVKCVYIDPPYNTGSAFDHYNDGVEHSIWLSLMRDRLEILWRLLRDDGSLWVSIDDAEMPYLRILLDEICGRQSFLATNVWQKRYSRENREAIGDAHEYILVYAKDPARFKAIRNKLPLGPKQLSVYKNPNNDPKGPWRTIPITAQAGHATAAQFYDIRGPTGIVFNPPRGNCWRYTKPVFERLRAEGKIYFGKTGTSQPTTIRYLSDIEGIVPWTWWPHEEAGHTDESKKEIQALFGKEDAFDTPKPERLIERIVQIATNSGEWVLDSFAGSGTTGAVAHKMGRRWILVELGDHCETLIAPRLKKVIDGEDQGGITDAVGWKGGGGFRYYRLAPSLLEQDAWGNWVISKKFNPPMLAEAMCKLEGFQYAPSAATWWQHGQSTERDFIYVTTQTLTREQLEHLSHEVGDDRTLLVCCGAFRTKADAFSNLTLKRIPHAVMERCEWGRDDYSLKIAELPGTEPALTVAANGDASAPVTVAHPRSTKRAGGRKPAALSLPLFGEEPKQ
jgi:adenine-specific DNA-methyltransferase